MRRLAWGIALGSVLGLVSCGDSKPKKVDGGDAGGGGDAPATCMGTFAFATRAQLGAGAKSAGKCASAADLDVICSNDVGGRVRALGGACFIQNPTGGEAALAMCTITALKADTVPDPSDACLGCYLGVTGCTLANCRTECAADPTASMCLQCQIAKGCLPTFYACSGLPTPPGFPVSDGGAGDGGDGGVQSDAEAGADTAAETAADSSGDTASEGGETVAETSADTAAETAAETAAD
jgi:hypothetical protein